MTAFTFSLVKYRVTSNMVVVGGGSVSSDREFLKYDFSIFVHLLSENFLRKCFLHLFHSSVTWFSCFSEVDYVCFDLIPRHQSIIRWRMGKKHQQPPVL